MCSAQIVLMMHWQPEIDWQTPAGRALRSLIAALPPGREFDLTLFGSSPLQIGIEPTFTSADIDLFATDEQTEEVKAAVRRAGLEKSDGGEIYVQVCVEWNFRTSPRWHRRAHRERIGTVSLTLPTPVDILIAKLHRLEEKDLRAFRLVIERTGHPTQAELREELQAAVDLFRPNFDESVPSDITANTRILWRELWGREMDVRKEIIAPALARIREGYAPDLARADYKAELRRLSES